MDTEGGMTEETEREVTEESGGENRNMVSEDETQTPQEKGDTD